MFTYASPKKGSIDWNNRVKIFELVKNHFSLDVKSLDYFEQELFTPAVPEELADFFGRDNVSLRVRKKIDEIDFLEEQDAGWEKFLFLFSSFCNYYNVSYKDFRNGKIVINKNKIKIRKALINFYTDEKNIKKTNISFFGYAKFEEMNEEAIRKITNRIDFILEDIGTRSIPKSDNFEVVASLNFADWFLCSTAEKWNSCLSLTTDYEYAYWTGIPGLIGDKNRIMIYATSGKNKNYQGIITKSFSSRSWAVLTDEDKFAIIAWYPSQTISTNVLNNYFNAQFFSNFSDDDFFEWRSKYPINFLFDENGNSRFIYQDNSKFKRKNSMGIYIYGADKAEHEYISEYDSYVQIHYGDLYCLPFSLDNLINEDATIFDKLEGNLHCSICDDYISNGYELYCEDEILCRSCYDQNCVETYDNGTMWMDDAIWVESEGEYFSTLYAENNFVRSAHDDGFYRIEDCYSMPKGNFILKDEVKNNPETYVFVEDDYVEYKDNAVYDKHFDEWYSKEYWRETIQKNQLSLFAS